MGVRQPESAQVLELLACTCDLHEVVGVPHVTTLVKLLYLWHAAWSTHSHEQVIPCQGQIRLVLMVSSDSGGQGGMARKGLGGSGAHQGGGGEVE